MQTYIALIRGINVSGHKKIKMAELKCLFESLNLCNVQTYIQSGNVIFQAPVQSQGTLASLIQGAIQAQYSFEVPVLVFNKNEFNTIHDNIPLKIFNVSDLAKEGTKVCISFLSKQPEQSAIDKLLTYVVAPEQLIIKNQVAYLYCPNGYGITKLSNNFIENKLKVNVTTRNWKSVVKIQEMID